jgi:hypothetical protein
MDTRHEAIGVKQTIRFEWMQKAANLLLAGLDAKTIRQELHEFLAGRRGNGADGERGTTSRTQVVNILMKVWVSPDLDLMPFRDASLTYLREEPAMAPAIHWGMISAAYPFWFNVARQTGRLLALQDQVTQTQIVGRLKEQYGDRQTVSRYARCVIRSFVAWDVLKDSAAKGCYESAAPVGITDAHLVALMLESALLAIPDAKGVLGLLLGSPAFFPFQLPPITGDRVSHSSERIEVVRYGLDDELLRLKAN